ncbi:amidase [Auritidibacter ignavus]|uniref:amidase n=1 Tax=Auritidibacter TaxID=1160973 RepID=UPI000D738D32|nr:MULTISPECIES: amidase [Auritidibacter]PXA80588.1 amidase [Auritidibacter sp. NML120636]WGH81122.1 amidase [Auritidibacter ignavus]WGH85711.1 amidase [Auritidibacter ignavus]WGH87998.1 amidase [Auritidibacter ignavus]
MTDLAELSASELVQGYAQQDFTPVEVTEAVLDRIDQDNGDLNAFVLVARTVALSMAEDSTRRWKNGEPLGPGDGVPTSIKDLLLTKGWPTLRGSRLISEDGPWPDDAPAVARLREAGAVFIGKVTTPEFAWKALTDCLRHGVTTNPWDISRHAGGSSGGGAAAVAAGMGPWSVGTDGGGSLRIPASFTGTVTLKPTYGTVPLYPSSPFGTLAHGGPMTRTVTDAAVMMDIISGFDSRDWSALPTPIGSFTEGLDDGVRGVRIAYSPTLGFGRNDPEVQRLVENAVHVFEDHGAHIEQVDPPISDPIEPFQLLWFTGAAKVLEAYGPNALEAIDPGLRQGIEKYHHASALDYLSAQAVRMDLGMTMGAFHETYDLLVTPTMPITAFDCTSQMPVDWEGEFWTSWTPYTYPFNMTQQPAASVPCGVSPADGLPVGLQIIAARTQDRLVLRAARAYEQAAGEQFVRPIRPHAA